MQSKTTPVLLSVLAALAMTSAVASLHLPRLDPHPNRLAAIPSWVDGAIRLQAPGLTWAPLLAQESEEEEEVPPEDVEKYVAVYKAMQRDHSLTVDRAVAQQGLTLAQFRGIEDKIERDDLIRERVREALRNNAAASPIGQPSPQGSPRTSH